MFHVYIVEDDQTIADILREHLTRWGYTVEVCTDFHDVLSDFVRVHPHLVLMDLSLPFFNGHHWCQQIRRVSTVPVLFISSSGSNMDIVMAVNMGGDDYLVKPFDLDVVTAKVQALLRRTYDFAGTQTTLEHRGLILDIGQSAMLYGEQKAELTRNESRILQRLLENKGQTVTRGDLMKTLWDSDYFVDDNTLTVNMTRLRHKLDDMGLNDFIVTRKGQGYLVALL